VLNLNALLAQTALLAWPLLLAALPAVLTLQTQLALLVEMELPALLALLALPAVPALLTWRAELTLLAGTACTADLARPAWPAEPL